MIGVVVTQSRDSLLLQSSHSNFTHFSSLPSRVTRELCTWLAPWLALHSHWAVPCVNEAPPAQLALCPSSQGPVNAPTTLLP